MTLIFDPTGWAALEWKQTGDPTKIVAALRSEQPLSAKARAVIADCIERPPKKRRGPKPNATRQSVVRSLVALHRALTPNDSLEEIFARVADVVGISEDAVSRLVYPRAPKPTRRR